jgi:hypothetical protein
MNEELFDEAKTVIESSGLSLLEAECRPEMSGSWHIIVDTKPLRRLFWDRQSGWLVLEEELTGVLNGPRIWKDIWMSQNLDRSSLGRGVRVLAEKCRIAPVIEPSG